MTDENEPELPDIQDAEVISEERALVNVDRSATALAAQARATLQARVWLALERPRNLAKVRDTLLSLMKRPDLAEKAVYQIEKGQKKVVGPDGKESWEPNIIRGPTIKLANSLRIAMTNLGTEDMIVADDRDSRTISVVAVDYESNTYEGRTILVSKTVERRGFYDKQARKEVPPDRTVLSVRKNSYGKDVYLCRATEAEIQEAANSAASRARRNAIIALAPADIVADAQAQALAIMTSVAAANRARTIAGLKPKFGKIGVTQLGLSEYLGKPIDDATEHELVGLEMLLNAIADGHDTWQGACRARAEARAAEEPEAVPSKEPSAKGAAATRAAVERATKGES